MLLAASCSKNFGLYRDRVGAAFAVASARNLTAGSRAANLALAEPAELLLPARPRRQGRRDHPRTTPRCKADWMAELEAMRQTCSACAPASPTRCAARPTPTASTSSRTTAACSRCLGARPGAGGGAARRVTASTWSATAGSTSPACPRSGLDQLAARHRRRRRLTRVTSPTSPPRTSRTGSTGFAWPTRSPRAIAAPAPRSATSSWRRGADTLLSRAAWIDGLGVAVKSVTVVPGNAARGLPSVHGALVLFDDVTGAGRGGDRLRPRDPVEDRRRFDPRRPAARPAGFAAAAHRRRRGGGGLAGRGLSRGFPGDRGHDLEPHRRTGPRALAATTGAAAVAGPRRGGRGGGHRRDRDDVARAGAARRLAAPRPASRPDRRLQGRHARGGRRLPARARGSSSTVSTRRSTISASCATRSRAASSRARTCSAICAISSPAAPGARSADEITLFKNGGGAHLDLMTARVILAAWRDGRS